MKDEDGIDISEMLLTGAFNTFKHYVDSNNLLDESQWEMPARSRTFKEMKYLYNWWVDSYLSIQKEWDQINEQYPQFTILSGREAPHDPLVMEYMDRVRNVISMERERKYEENHNLMRLIKLRNHI